MCSFKNITDCEVEDKEYHYQYMYFIELQSLSLLFFYISGLYYNNSY